MGLKFLNNVDMQKNEIDNALYHKAATAPSNPTEGQYYYNTTDKEVYYYNGTEWIAGSSSVGGMSTKPTTITCTLPDLPESLLTIEEMEAIVIDDYTNGGTAEEAGVYVSEEGVDGYYYTFCVRNSTTTYALVWYKVDATSGYFEKYL